MSLPQILPELTTLQVTLDEGVAIVTLDRADKANAMSQSMWEELGQVFRWLDETAEVRVVILQANGRNFCAGMDLMLLASASAEFGEDIGRNAESLRRKILWFQAVLSGIERCRKPVLAAIHGKCLGGAIDMITCCDMRYCTEDASFAVKETEVGMAADVGTLQRLPKLIGDGIARELCYTARELGGAEAERIGLVNRTFGTQEALFEGVLDIARTIARHSPLAVRGTKEMILYSRDHSVADSLNFVATWNASALMSGDLQKSLEAKLTGAAVTYED